MIRVMIRFALLFSACVLSNSGHASEGVLEINQACALSTGCFAGDAVGFPVQITASGSYRLTGNLDISALPNTTAIDVNGSHITLDLNGFEIRGPITCTGSGPTLDCGNAFTADGIALSSNASFVTIRDGTIRNMSGHGVGDLGNELRMINVTARHNAQDGLNGGANSIAINCIAHENGDDGFKFGAGSVIKGAVAFGNGSDGIRIEAPNGLIQDSTSRNNGERGFVMGHSSKFGHNASTGNQLPDECGGGICSSERRFYLTVAAVPGNAVLTACADGFHTASVTEIFDHGSFRYDPILGRTIRDSGLGMLTGVLGWIRSGNAEESEQDCDEWSSNDNFLSGTVTRWSPSSDWSQDALRSSPWQPNISVVCSSLWPVWCVEN